MNPIDAFINEFTHEAAATRRLLQRVPEEQFGWKPHEKSMSLGVLASHIADTPHWTAAIMGQDEFEMDLATYKPFVAGSQAELLDHLDAGVAITREAVQGASIESLMTLWRFKIAGEVKFEMPRLVTLRSFIISHLIHHRGQLTVYLRLRDVPLPAIYGPTADEGG